MTREFLVDITVSLPRGEGPEDWAYVGHLFVDVSDEDLGSEVLAMAEVTKALIENWIGKYPQVHDCLSNAEYFQDFYKCTVCGADETIAKNRLLLLSSERRVNERATGIVSG